MVEKKSSVKKNISKKNNSKGEKKSTSKVSTKKVEKVEAEVIDKEEEPSWYHYAIIIIVFFGIFVVAYFVFNFFYDNSKVNNPNLLIDLYEYEFETSDGRNVKIDFFNPIDTIDTFDYPIEINKINFQNSNEIYLSFLEYNGTDNGKLIGTTGRFAPFVNKLYRIPMDVDKHFVKHNVTNCTHSTIESKVVVFNPYSDRNGVYFNTTSGCITFETDDPIKMNDLGDKFFLTLIEQEKE